MAMTFTVSAGRMVYAETVDENHEVPDGVTVNGMELGGLTVKAAEDKLQQYMDEVCGGSVTLTVSGEDVTFAYKDFDMHAAEAVLLLRQRESLPLSLFLELPSPRQPEGWPASERQRYEHILAEADGYRYASFRNDATAMFARNRRLVERSDCCIAYLARPSGGTFYTVNYALSRGLFVYQLAERLRP